VVPEIEGTSSPPGIQGQVSGFHTVNLREKAPFGFPKVHLEIGQSIHLFRSTYVGNPEHRVCQGHDGGNFRDGGDQEGLPGGQDSVRQADRIIGVGIPWLGPGINISHLEILEIHGLGPHVGQFDVIEAGVIHPYFGKNEVPVRLRNGSRRHGAGFEGKAWEDPVGQLTGVIPCQ